VIRRISSSVTIGLLAKPQTPLWMTRTPKPPACRSASVGIVPAGTATAAAAPTAEPAATGAALRGEAAMAPGRLVAS
jgi:hypothetical protein